MSGMKRTGLKKCVPRKFLRKSSERPSAMAFTERPEVFVQTTDPFFRKRSTCS